MHVVQNTRGSTYVFLFLSVPVTIVGIYNEILCCYAFTDLKVISCTEDLLVRVIAIMIILHSQNEIVSLLLSSTNRHATSTYWAVGTIVLARQKLMSMLLVDI